MKHYFYITLMLFSLSGECQDQLDSLIASEALKPLPIKSLTVIPVQKLKLYVATANAGYQIIFKTKIIPGQEYALARIDSLNDKYWLNDNSGSPVIMETFYSSDNSIKGTDFDNLFWSKRFVESIKKQYGLKIWQKLIEREVSIGWNEDLCRLSWGFPKDINRTKTSFGTSEQWIYNTGYLYFENGKLIAIQY